MTGVVSKRSLVLSVLASAVFLTVLLSPSYNNSYSWTTAGTGWRRFPPPKADDDAIDPSGDPVEEALANNENVAVKTYVQEVRGGRLERAREAPAVETGRVWVSMGLCFGENAKVHGKKDYPYAAVTPLAILLWRHFTDVQVSQAQWSSY